MSWRLEEQEMSLNLPLEGLVPLLIKYLTSSALYLMFQTPSEVSIVRTVCPVVLLIILTACIIM